MKIINPSKVQDLIDNGFNLDVADCISQGIEMVKKDTGLYVAYTIVYFVIVVVAGLIPFADQIISPPLIAGFYLFSHKILKNEPAEFADFFKGFDYFGQLLVQHLMLLAIAILVSLPAIAAAFSIGLFEFELHNNLPEIGLVALLSFGLATIGLIYVSTIYLFAPFLIIFGDYQAWDAMETSRKVVSTNFWSILGLLIISVLFMLAGALLCLVGLLFTLPAAYAAYYYAFYKVFDLDNVDNTPQNDILDHLVD